MSRDPLAEKAGVNLHAYVRNEPTNLGDLQGLQVGALPIGPLVPPVNPIAIGWDIGISYFRSPRSKLKERCPTAFILLQSDSVGRKFISKNRKNMSDSHYQPPKTNVQSAPSGSSRKGRVNVGPMVSHDWPDVPIMTGNPRTIICDRQGLIRQGLRAMIGSSVTIIAEASTGQEAIELIRGLGPNLVIIDVDLDELDGLAVCRETQRTLPHPGFLFFTDSYHATRYYYQLLRAGMQGICLKCSGPAELFKAIQQLDHSKPYCDPAIARFIAQSSAGTATFALTVQENEVLLRLELRNKEIAEELGIKLQAVEKQIERILFKLQVPTRAAASQKAEQLGYMLLPVLPLRDPTTGQWQEQIMANNFAEEAIRRASELS